MAQGKKTVSVLFLLESANKALSADYSPDVKPNVFSSTEERARAHRAGVASLLERALHESGNYNGFGYLDSPYVAGQTDETRRSYYYSEAMHKAKREKDGG